MLYVRGCFLPLDRRIGPQFIFGLKYSYTRDQPLCLFPPCHCCPTLPASRAVPRGLKHCAASRVHSSMRALSSSSCRRPTHSRWRFASSSNTNRPSGLGRPLNGVATAGKRVRMSTAAPAAAAAAASVEVVAEELPTNEGSEELLKIRHTSAHVMAMAVQKLFPETQVTIGPWIDNG